MAWTDGIFHKFLQYWTRPKEIQEKKPYFWADAVQKADAEKEQPIQYGKETERIFYMQQEKADTPKEEKKKEISIFQQQVLPMEKRERLYEKPMFLQKDRESISAPTKEKHNITEKILQKENALPEAQLIPLQKKDVFSFLPEERKNKKQKEQGAFRQKETQILQTENASFEQGKKSIFLEDEKEKTAEKREKGISPVIQEMTKEYRTEALLQQIVQYAGQKAEAGTEQKISVQIGQVQKSADVDMIIAEITKKLWEARSVGRCSIERR